MRQTEEWVIGRVKFKWGFKPILRRRGTRRITIVRQARLGARLGARQRASPQAPMISGEAGRRGAATPDGACRLQILIARVILCHRRCSVMAVSSSRGQEARKIAIIKRGTAMYLPLPGNGLLRAGLSLLVVGVGLTPMMAPAAGAASSTSPAAVLQTETCPTGAVLVLPVSSVVDADGWIRMNYSINGVQSYKEVPPAGFQPAVASDDLLARHGFPVRPAAAADLTAWTTRMSQATWPRTQGTCESTQTKFTGYQHYSNNWGGDEFRSQPAYNFVGVESYLVQPTLGTGCGTKSTLGSWVGLGGDGSPNLIQTGTYALGPGWGSISGYRSWWEYINSSSNTFTYFGTTVGPTDPMFEEVLLSGSQALVEVYNAKTGSIDHQYVNIGSDYFGNSAEYIDERPTMSDGLDNLTNYGWTSWSSMYVRRSNSVVWTGAYSEPTEWWKMMKDSSGLELSQTTGTYSDNHMQDHWHNCI